MAIRKPAHTGNPMPGPDPARLPQPERNGADRCHDDAVRPERENAEQCDRAQRAGEHEPRHARFGTSPVDLKRQSR